MFNYITVVSSIVVIANAAQLSRYSRPALDLNSYIYNTIEDAKPYLVDGFPELSIPSLKHISFPYSYINRSNFEFGVWNYNVTGLEVFNIQKVDADLKNNVVKLQLEFPYGEGDGYYGCKGKLLNLNVDGTGRIKVNGTKLIVNIELEIKMVHRDGHDYLEQVHRSIEAHILDSFHMDLFDLYSGNSKISDILNLVINDNSFYMFELLSPILVNQFDKMLEKAIDTIFQTYTYEQLLP